MKKEINIPIILDAVKKIGNTFLHGFKRKNIPQNREKLFNQLDEIDTICLLSLKQDLAKDFPETPWFIGDEFDTESQRNPANFDEYWLCEAMDGAMQYVQHISGWTINLVLTRNGKPFF